ncbi:biotin-dependent carboxyltransferase family protein [Rubritalea spongiae]|uniref:Biotin-dependent carboxyltransferase family protein n=1 Tax=Rubritalea spongiae TaxID=430797 RepID=A0ABW5E1Z6_9BACT
MTIAIVRKIGAGISFQDQGRVDANSWLNYGVAPAGTMDAYAAQAANTLVHNLPTDTVLEIALGGAEIEITANCWLAHTGGCACPELPRNTARFVKKGETLRFNPNPHGVWSYLAIAGGWQAAQYFGSSSRHQRSDLGQDITVDSELRANTSQPPASSCADSRFLPLAKQRDYSSPPPLRLIKGPHANLFKEQDWLHLLRTEWIVSPRSDRTGYRLTGSNTLSHNHSIYSTPTLVGSVQIPPNGEPIVTLNDGPTVGGYPILARVHPDDLSWLVQQHAHQKIHFNEWRGHSISPKISHL